MTRDEIGARRAETLAFFDAAARMAEIIERLTSDPLAEYDADTVTRRLCDLVITSDGTDSESGEPITGPARG